MIGAKKPYLFPAVFFIFATAALWLVRKVMVRLWHRRARKSFNDWDDRIIAVVKTPLS